MTDTMKNAAASPWLKPGPCWSVSETANSTASNPNSVVNLMIGLSATDDVSLNGSPTVSPTTVAACKSVPFCFNSTSTIFFALSHAPPALAMKIAWYRPNSAIDTRYPMKKYGSTNAKASVAKNTVRKMLNMPSCAYLVQISTTFLVSSTDAFLSELRSM